MTAPGVEPGLSRPQRDVLTTRRCGLAELLALLTCVQILSNFLAMPFFMKCKNHFRLIVRRGIDKEEERAVPGIEPGTSCTRSRNHTTRPNSQMHKSTVCKKNRVNRAKNSIVYTRVRKLYVAHEGTCWNSRCNLPKDTLAERLRRRPAKPMGSPRVGSNPTGVVLLVSSCTHLTNHTINLHSHKKEGCSGNWTRDLSHPKRESCH